jgi:hypothetical protein
MPVTCELCGKWLPNHLSRCSRYGLSPDQWPINGVVVKEEASGTTIARPEAAIIHTNSTNLLFSYMKIFMELNKMWLYEIGY